MKEFKTVDCFIQGILIAAAIVFNLQRRRFDLDEEFLWGYFVVGGWQIISVIVHFFYKAPYEIKMRKIYLITLGALIVALLGSLPMSGLMIMLFVLLFFSPVMAVYYLITCIKETQKLSLIRAQSINPDQLPG